MASRYLYPLIILSAGCAQVIRDPEPLPEPAGATTSRGGAPTGDSQRTWVFRSSIEPHTYTSITKTDLELISGPMRDHDSVTQHLRFTLTLQPTAAAANVTGTIDAFSIETGERIGRSAQSIRLPFAFVGRTVGTGAILFPADPLIRDSLATCINPARIALTVVQRQITAVPLELTRGKTWIDSTSTSGCSGSIPVTVTTVRQYRVAGEADYKGTKTVLVERAERFQASGEGSQDQHRIIVSSEGSGSGKLYLDVITGLLRRADAEYRIRLTVSSSGRTQQFNQTVTEQVSTER